MIKIKSVLAGMVAVLLVGCSAPNGPMNTASYGPVETPVFEPVALALIKDGSRHVQFKDRGCMLINQTTYGDCGVFFTTDKGVYMAHWNTKTFEYSLLYHLDRKNLRSVSVSKYVRKFGVDSDLLVIQDNSGYEVNFDLRNVGAARYDLLGR